jgi:hypothetical protein
VRSSEVPDVLLRGVAELNPVLHIVLIVHDLPAVKGLGEPLASRRGWGCGFAKAAKTRRRSLALDKVANRQREEC